MYKSLIPVNCHPVPDFMWHWKWIVDTSTAKQIWKITKLLQNLGLIKYQKRFLCLSFVFCNSIHCCEKICWNYQTNSFTSQNYFCLRPTPQQLKNKSNNINQHQSKSMSSEIASCRKYFYRKITNCLIRLLMTVWNK